MDCLSGKTGQMTLAPFAAVRFLLSSLALTSLPKRTLSSDPGLLVSSQALRLWVICHQVGSWQEASLSPPDTLVMHSTPGLGGCKSPCTGMCQRATGLKTPLLSRKKQKWKQTHFYHQSKSNVFSTCGNSVHVLRRGKTRLTLEWKTSKVYLCRYPSRHRLHHDTEVFHTAERLLFVHEKKELSGLFTNPPYIFSLSLKSSS